jgi:hypothetical protein
MNLKSKIINYVNEKNDIVPFCELTEKFPEMIGDYGLAIHTNEFGHCVFWTGLSEAAISALHDLRKGTELKTLGGPYYYHVYYRYGNLIPYPIHKFKNKVMQPHWVPIVLVCRSYIYR